MALWSPGCKAFGEGVDVSLGLAVRQGCCGLTIVYTGSKGNVPPLHLLSLVSLVRAPSQDSPMCVPVCMSTLYQLLGNTPRDQPNTQSQVNYV